MVIAAGAFARTAVLSVLLAGAAAGIAQAAPGDGYVRLAHLSPDTPAVDVYLYTNGDTKPRLVLRHVAYGALSPYQRLSAGSYSVAMRPADAAASSPPVLSTNVNVQGGESYTVAGMGPYKGIRLRILHDTSSLTSGQAAIRVIQASLRAPTIDVTAAGQPFASALHFPDATPYRPLPTGTTAVAVSGPAGGPTTTNVTLTAGSLHTVIVLDGDTGLKLVDLSDTTQGAVTPRGSVNTGLGGLAHPKPYDWSLPAAAALAAMTTAALTLYRTRRHPNAQPPEVTPPPQEFTTA